MSLRPIFITGIGTGIGKTIISAIITEALQADYWKPLQAGYDNGTDTLLVKNLLSNDISVIRHEVYKFSLAASPHIAAKKDSMRVDLNCILEKFGEFANVNRPIVIEGAGGILVPLNEQEFVSDLIQKLNAKVILVSRNYLGSINHSLLTAAYCKEKKIDILGWIFNDQYMDYEDDIVSWSGINKIASIPFLHDITKESIRQEASRLKASLQLLLL